MLFNFQEILDIVLMSFFVGYLFSDMFIPLTRHKNPYNLPNYRLKRFDWEAIKISMLITAPAIILHEFGHKFTALYFGFHAVFHAAYTWLLLGGILKMMNFGFIFFVPAYVQILGTGTHLQYALVAFAGPFVNFLLYLISDIVVKKRLVEHRYIVFFIISKKINLFLFIFNLIPIPGFDGYHVLRHLYLAF